MELSAMWSQVIYGTESYYSLDKAPSTEFITAQRILSRPYHSSLICSTNLSKIIIYERLIVGLNDCD